MQAFDGINVVDFTHVLAGPFSTYQLAVMGASVTKIESPRSGDMMRPEGYSDAMESVGRGTQFICQNGNKRSLAVDLGTEDGVGVVRELLKTADVVVENFRGGVLERKGLGYEDVTAINPGVIYCSITGFGRTGPKADHPAYDNVIQAFSGLMAATGTPETHPVRVGPAVLDYGTGAQAAFAISAALFQRSRTNKGQRIDVSMTDAALMLMTSSVLDAQVLGNSPAPFGNQNPDRPGYSLYDASDAPIMIGAFTAKQNSDLWRALGDEERARTALVETKAETKATARETASAIAAVIRSRSADEWEQHLNEHGVPAARVRSIDETISHPQIQSRSVMQPIDVVPESGAQLHTPVAAFGYEHDGPSVDTLAPALGQHSEEILREIGYADEEIKSFAERGVIAVAS